VCVAEPNQLREALRADWARNPNRDSRATLLVWRLGQAAHRSRTPVGFVLRRLHSVLDVLWVRAYVGAELPRSVRAGPGLRLPHAGRGVVLHPDCRLGSGVTLYHQVTMGVRGERPPPRVGDRVSIGAGAALLGDIEVGDGATVGARSVVVADVEPGSTVVGAPARATASSRRGTRSS